MILVESFSIILIAWGIPILLTMYHCRVLYLFNISTCPKIKDYLALFLFTDLFNSSTNCLLYSLSGKLFRRKFLCVIKTILTCGRGSLWHVKQHSLLTQNQPLDRQLSNNPSTNTNNNFAKQTSRPGSGRYSERLSSPIGNNNNNTNKRFNYSPRATMMMAKRLSEQNPKDSDDGSLSMGKTSDEHPGGKNSVSEMDSDVIRKPRDIQLRKSSQSI